MQKILAPIDIGATSDSFLTLLYTLLSLNGLSNTCGLFKEVQAFHSFFFFFKTLWASGLEGKTVLDPVRTCTKAPKSRTAVNGDAAESCTARNENAAKSCTTEENAAKCCPACGAERRKRRTTAKSRRAERRKREAPVATGRVREVLRKNERKK